MSTDTTEYHRVIPLAPGHDADLLRWLTRESFENLARNDGLVITEYAEEQVTPSHVPMSVARDLELPVDQYDWWLFTATVTRPEREELPDHCGYCAPHPSHRTKCGIDTDAGPCGCPGWPL
ncbi:hypothetical protein SEA_TYPHA_120 [Mycobacterium phage Typha]|uniref:Minor tail protein n=1 Tax=Mycobacterium phage Typha TaxID=2517971 RepID=A0A482JAU7_9CAUD|nr:minor tail protein [Mycobacterium phage Typha]QBP29775.1 hypothetical protein SEA_TYPHA_120 [Mycobacterium phage Typha]